MVNKLRSQISGYTCQSEKLSIINHTSIDLIGSNKAWKEVQFKILG